MNRKQLPASGQPRESNVKRSGGRGLQQGTPFGLNGCSDDHWVALICRRGYNKWWFVRWDRRYDSR